ncbi:mechanosensitive ion channel family protein [Gemmatimonadota bacterium]
MLPIVRKGTKIVVWTIALIVALNNAGYDVGAVLAGLGIGGLALAMAAKDTVSNIFGGFTIFTDRPFTINERVKVAGFDGTVKEIGIRSTRLQTLAGTMVTIPNSTFADSPVENVSLEPSRKVTTNLGLTYDTSPEKMEKAIELLQTIGAEHEALDEKVLTSFNAFGDFAMNILFIYYILPGNDILQTQTDINLRILKEFTAEGLDFAFPTQTILASVEQKTA